MLLFVGATLPFPPLRVLLSLEDGGLLKRFFKIEFLIRCVAVHMLRSAVDA